MLTPTAIFIDRRQLALAAVGLSVGSSAATAPPARSAFERYLLVKGAIDDRLVIATLAGIYHAVQDGVLTPLHGLLTVSFSRYRRLPDGSVRQRIVEAEYYTDLAGRTVIHEWRNVLTGEMATLPPLRRGVTEFILHPDLTVTGVQFGPALHAGVTGSFELGENVWIDEKFAFIPQDEAAPRSTEMITYRARASDLARPGVTRVRADVDYQVFSKWRAWQAMGSIPGTLVLRGSGSAKIDFAEVPALWAETTRRVWPELLRSPGAILDA